MLDICKIKTIYINHYIKTNDNDKNKCSKCHKHKFQNFNKQECIRFWLHLKGPILHSTSKKSAGLTLKTLAECGGRCKNNLGACNVS